MKVQKIKAIRPADTERFIGDVYLVMIDFPGFATIVCNPNNGQAQAVAVEFINDALREAADDLGVDHSVIEFPTR